MKIILEERTNPNELIIFLKPETIEDSTQVLRICGSMKGENSGYASFHNNVSGWISIPTTSKMCNYIKSGNTKF